jgi:lipoprotein-anchoring transpeptidase ErfK/SrfK
MGVPGSKGCIRIRNNDVIELFEKVQIGEDVVIMKP